MSTLSVRQEPAMPVEAELPRRKSPGVTKVAHVSDLHVTSTTTFSEDCWIALRADLESHPVDLIVVTGDVIDGSLADLTNRRIEQALARASTFLTSKLCAAASIDPATRLFVVPGNHDYRLKGMLRRGDRPAALFRSAFGAVSASRHLPDLNLVVFAFDSNQAEWLSNGARGLVSSAALVKAHEVQQEVARASPEGWARATRLALLHHHPLPLADQSRGLRNRDEYLLLKNAGVFLRELVKLGVDIVLHGHKHASAVARLILPTSPNGADELVVLGAGSVAPGPGEPPSYSVVHLHDSGKVVLERRSLRVATYEPEPSLVLRDYAQQRARHARRLLEEAPLSLRADGLRYHLVIDSNGDAVTESTVTHVRSSTDSAVTYVQRFLKTRAGRPGTPTYESQTLGTSIGFTWSGPPDAEGRREGRLQFSPALRNEPVSFVERHSIYNAFCFDQATRSAITGMATDSEHWSCRVKKHLDTLALAIVFPASRFPNSFDLEAFDTRNEVDLEESEYARHFLHLLPASRSVGFLLPCPLPSYRYQIRWRLPETAAEDFPLTAAQESLLERFLAALDAFAGTVATANSRLAPQLHDAWDRIQSCLLSLGEQTDASLEVHFYVASPRAASVRYVDCAGAARKPGHEVLSGESLVGQAFRRRAFLPSFDSHGPDGASPPTFYEPCVGAGGFSALAAYPLLVPVEHGRPVGVLLLVSRAPGSSLRAALSDKSRARELEAILSLWYRTQLSEAIGLPDALPSGPLIPDGGGPGETAPLPRGGPEPPAPNPPVRSAARRSGRSRRVRQQEVERRLLRLERRVGFGVQETVIRWEMLDLEGTVRQTWLHRGVTVREDFSLEELRLGVFMPCPENAAVVEPPALSVANVRPGSEYQIRTAMNPRGELEVFLRNARGGRLQVEGASFAVSRVMARGALVWREDVERTYARDAIRHEYARAQAISPTRALKLEVRFPPGYGVQAFPLVFLGKGEVLDPSPERMSALSFEASASHATVQIADPTDGRSYGIGWFSPRRNERAREEPPGAAAPAR